ncbi:hypothetical protein A6A08_08775 [Nocardiopsis sp. TSRI0078]|uniref:hypothetical protein n=1 Tax=unclassified Nocardiopsis TaxID=2649073 RepID=UPI00093F8447|nr:hypothetical protein [Nocardiopsis sp. TSRI0078]OKI15659.1 hypothetical protein A6A08_08775 [Nocardiopsis sp. TSRI0078]
MRDQPGTDPLPPWALEGRSAALAAFDRCDDGSDVARLTGEAEPATEVLRSAEDGADGVAVAVLRFEHEDLTMDLQVHSEGRLRALSGLATGECEHAVLHVRRPGSSDRLRVGEDGRFTLSGLARGPISLSLRRMGHPTVVTDWFTI